MDRSAAWTLLGQPAAWMRVPDIASGQATAGQGGGSEAQAHETLCNRVLPICPLRRHTPMPLGVRVPLLPSRGAQPERVRWRMCTSSYMCDRGALSDLTASATGCCACQTRRPRWPRRSPGGCSHGCRRRRRCRWGGGTSRRRTRRARRAGRAAPHPARAALLAPVRRWPLPSAAPQLAPSPAVAGWGRGGSSWDRRDPLRGPCVRLIDQEGARGMRSGEG